MCRALCHYTLGLSAILITAATPATLPTPSTTRALSPEEEARGEAALDQLIPADVREGRREPNERERTAFRLVMALRVADNGLNEKSHAKNLSNRREAERQLKQSISESQAKWAGASPEVLQELAVIHRLQWDQLRLNDVMDRPATFPSDDDSSRDLALRIAALPNVLDRSALLERDLPYHNKRFELLGEIDRLKRAQAAGGKAQDSKRLEALQRLLTATDAAYAAQVDLDKLDSAPAWRATTAPAARIP